MNMQQRCKCAYLREDNMLAGEECQLLIILFLLVLILLHDASTTSLERFNPRPDFRLALFKTEARRSIFLTFSLPVLCLFCWLESGVLTNSCISTGVDLFDVIRANAIRKVCGKLLLKAIGG